MLLGIILQTGKSPWTASEGIPLTQSGGFSLLRQQTVLALGTIFAASFDCFLGTTHEFQLESVSYGFRLELVRDSQKTTKRCREKPPDCGTLCGSLSDDGVSGGTNQEFRMDE